MSSGKTGRRVRASGSGRCVFIVIKCCRCRFYVCREDLLVGEFRLGQSVMLACQSGGSGQCRGRGSPTISTSGKDRRPLHATDHCHCGLLARVERPRPRLSPSAWCGGLAPPAPGRITDRILSSRMGGFVLLVDWVLSSWMSLIPPGWKVGASARNGDAAGLSSTIPNTAGVSGFPCAVVNSLADGFLLEFWREFGGDRGDNLFKTCGLLPTPISHSAGRPLSPAWTRRRRSLSLHASSSNLILLLASCTSFHWLAV